MEPSDWYAINRAQPFLEEKMKDRIWKVKQASGKEI